MKFPKDLLSQTYTKPRIFLCEVDKTRICELQTTNTNATFKFNSFSELSFEVARIYNDLVTGETKDHPYYDKIEALRLIEVENFGFFEIQGPEITSNGIQEAKSVTAYSLEYTLSQKYLTNFIVNAGTTDSIEVINAEDKKKITPITLYNIKNPKLSLLHLVLGHVYGWSIGHVDESLKTMGPQFEVDKESVYDFLMNEVCEKCNCYFVFDTQDNVVHVYAERASAKFLGDGERNTFKISPPFSKVETVFVDSYKTTRWQYDKQTGNLTFEETPAYGKAIEAVDGSFAAWETDVFVSFDNLSNEVNINYDADSIKTKLEVAYADGGDIREINLGMPYLLDLSYYHTIDWMGKELYNAYSKYLIKSNNLRDDYIQNTQKILEFNDQIYYEEHRLSLDYSVVTVDSETVGTYYVKQTGDDKNSYYKEVSLPAEWVEGTTYYSNLTTNVNEDKVTKLANALKKYFTNQNKDDDGKTSWSTDMSKLETEFSFINKKTDDSISLTKLQASLSEVEDKRVKNANVKAAIKEFLAEIWIELGRTPLRTMFLDTYKQLRDTGIKEGRSDSKDENYGVHYTNLLFVSSIKEAVSALTEKIHALKLARKVPENANVKIANKLAIDNEANFTPEQLVKLSAFFREDRLEIDDIVETDQDSISDSLKVKQDAMESGKIELQKLCQPQLQFSMTMANIFALPEFEPIVEQFQLGNIITIALRPDYIKQSRLLQVNVNFDDFSEFSCDFGELMNLRTQSDIHADLLKNAVNAGKSVAANSGKWTRGADTATSTDLKLQQGLLDATTQIKSIDGTQGVVIDNYGIRLQKIIDNDEIDDQQTWLTNNMILMSDDGFQTSRVGLGKFDITYPDWHPQNKSSSYGLLADAVIAGYVEGSTIVGGEIYSSNYKSKERGTYFNLLDGDFEIAGGKMLYDPNKNELTLDGVTIEWKSTNAPKTSDIDGLDGTLSDTLEKAKQGIADAAGATTLANNASNKISELDTSIAKYFGLGGNTIIGNNYVISPIIGGGYLNITNTTSNSRVIIDPNNLTKKNYIFQVHNGDKIVMGVDNSGNAEFAGTIYATEGEIGGWSIEEKRLYSAKDGEKSGTGMATANSNTSVAFWAGYDGDGKTPWDAGSVTSGQNWTDETAFYVRNNGYMCSTKGVIGGWTIGKKTLSSSSSKYTVYLACYDNESDESRIFHCTNSANGNDSLSIKRNGEITIGESKANQLKLHSGYIDFFSNDQKSGRIGQTSDGKIAIEGSSLYCQGSVILDKTKYLKCGEQYLLGMTGNDHIILGNETQPGSTVICANASQKVSFKIGSGDYNEIGYIDKDGLNVNAEIYANKFITKGYIRFNFDGKQVGTIGATSADGISVRGAHVWIDNAKYIKSRATDLLTECRLIGLTSGDNVVIGSSTQPGSTSVYAGNDKNINFYVKDTNIGHFDSNGFTVDGRISATTLATSNYIDFYYDGKQSARIGSSGKDTINMSGADVYIDNAKYLMWFGTDSKPYQVIGMTSGNNIAIGAATQPGSTAIYAGNGKNISFSINDTKIGYFDTNGLTINAEVSATKFTTKGYIGFDFDGKQIGKIGATSSDGISIQGTHIWLDNAKYIGYRISGESGLSGAYRLIGGTSGDNVVIGEENQPGNTGIYAGKDKNINFSISSSKVGSFDKDGLNVSGTVIANGLTISGASTIDGNISVSGAITTTGKIETTGNIVTSGSIRLSKIDTALNGTNSSGESQRLVLLGTLSNNYGSHFGHSNSATYFYGSSFSFNNDVILGTNNKYFSGTAKDGTILPMLYTNASDNCIIGHGGYDKGYGATHLYGNIVRIGVRAGGSGNTVSLYKPYYDKGDSFDVEIDTAGYVTSSGTKVHFTIPLSKPVIGKPSISATSVNGFVLRQNNGYTHGSNYSTSDGVKYTTPSSCTAEIVDSNSISITATFSNTTNVTNNSSIGIIWDGKITFS